MTLNQLIDQLISEGGAIVCSDACSEMEIANASSHGRFAVNNESIGFVRRTKEWLVINKNRELAHPNTTGRYNAPSVEPKVTSADAASFNSKP